MKSFRTQFSSSGQRGRPSSSATEVGAGRVHHPYLRCPVSRTACSSCTAGPTRLPSRGIRCGNHFHDSVVARPTFEQCDGGGCRDSTPPILVVSRIAYGMLFLHCRAHEAAFSRHTRWQSFPRLRGSGAPRVIYAHRTCIEMHQVQCTYAAVCSGCLVRPSQHFSCAVLVWRWLYCSPGAFAKSRTSSAARAHT